ncbi:MAG: hybrid sensor histidine kinase/response regulator [Phormidesmis sp.]
MPQPSSDLPSAVAQPFSQPLPNRHPLSKADRMADIMVVDDTPDNLRLLLKILSEQGYSVRPVREGPLAIKAAQLSPPDVILLDIKMPGMDGYEVCRRLKADERTCGIPVVFLTVLDDVGDIIKGFELGGVDYITKPVRTGELLARIGNQVQLRSLQKQLIEHLETLKNTQSELIRAAKMAALGNLVAGVAHEINTPVGTAITSASTLENATAAIAANLRLGELKRSSFEDYLAVAAECSQLILNNLQRAGELVQSFKQVAVDQTSLKRRTFCLKPYLQEVITNLMPVIKQTPHRITLQGSDRITLHSYPGALSQIVTNFIINSLTHAYPDSGNQTQSGQLRIDIYPQPGQVVLKYSDDGCGISSANQNRIFEPFFTTARSLGGSGLGLHLIYNLVTQTLQGGIRVDSELGQGTTFTLTLPDRVGEKLPD